MPGRIDRSLNKSSLDSPLLCGKSQISCIIKNKVNCTLSI
ncbi:hypothetical protein GMES_0428 [Paraglaciecola mesophila KMM 241]|uniref:Uncharacterized protein n=1 Tax=Paraglaciecola mesophila KMM 241 TaxID=1128912 RepID=K6XQ13_9ALTE|nr:hypothetical protein GMES_0428 [Paraglaciecola mesophila KMM 241]